MGIAEIIPGVSASTLALIMGIYHNFISLLHQVSTFFKEIVALFIGKSSVKKVKRAFWDINYKFGVFLLAGMLIGLGGFSHIMSFLLENYPQYTFAFFFGLILTSVSIPWMQMERRGFKEVLIVLFTLVIFFFVLGLHPVGEAGRPGLVQLFFGGFIAVCAMVLPGISGSFVLLLLGLYHHVVSLVKDVTNLTAVTQDFLDLAVVFLGIVLGFSLFVRFLNFALHKYHAQLMAFLVGLMLASLRVLWPFMDAGSSSSVETMAKLWPWQSPLIEALTIVLIILTAAGWVLFINIRGRNRKKKEVEVEVAEAVAS